VSVVLRCTGRADGDIGLETGAYLQRFNDEAFGGRGYALWTTDRRRAMRFDTSASARAAAAVAPLRPIRLIIEPAP